MPAPIQAENLRYVALAILSLTRRSLLCALEHLAVSARWGDPDLQSHHSDA